MREGKEETLTDRMKRPVDERHKSTHGSLIDMFSQSHVFFNHKTVHVCEHGQASPYLQCVHIHLSLVQKLKEKEMEAVTARKMKFMC